MWRSLLEWSLRDGARSFGIWMFRALEDKGIDTDNVHNYAYDDDPRGRALRYRVIVSSGLAAAIRSMADEIEAKGWRITADKVRSDGRTIQMSFEPVLTARTKRPRVAWHLTPVATVDAVLRDGLQPRPPRRKDLRYPQDRVYLLRRKEHASQMARSFNSSHEATKGQYVLLRVDLDAARVPVHVDPELAKVALFTTDPIPASAIKVIGEIDHKPLWNHH